MTTTIRLGSLGDTVKALQTALNRWLESTGDRLVVDGFFGLRTNGTVRAYQRAHELAPDGAVGPITWASLRSLIDDVPEGAAQAAAPGRMAPMPRRPPQPPVALRSRAAARTWTASPTARRDALARLARSA